MTGWIGQRVRATYVRSEGAATDQDLTGPRPRPVVGLLTHLQRGDRMVVALPDSGGLWRTTAVQDITAELDTLRVTTRRSIYRLRITKEIA